MREKVLHGLHFITHVNSRNRPLAVRVYTCVTIAGKMTTQFYPINNAQRR
jgi:hypothetical protein